MFSFWKKQLGIFNKKTKKDKTEVSKEQEDKFWNKFDDTLDWEKKNKSDDLLNRAVEDTVTGSNLVWKIPKRPVLNIGEIKDRKDMMSVNRKRDCMDNNGQLLSDHEMLMLVTLNNFYLPNQAKGYYLECKEWYQSKFPKRSMYDIVWCFCQKIVNEMAVFNLKKAREYHEELENIRFNEKEERKKSKG